MLDRRALNRALLERQLLLKRVRMPACDAIERLVGIQSQVPHSAYFALWARLSDFCKEELINLINDRKVVWITMMRSTIHLVTDPHCLEYRLLLQQVLEQSLKGNFGWFLKEIDVNEFKTIGRMMVEKEPRTLSGVGKILNEHWIERDSIALANAI